MSGSAELLDLVRGVAHDFGLEPTADGVATSIVRHGRPVGVQTVAIATIDGERLVTIASEGMLPVEADLYRALPLSVAAPGTDAARLGVPVYLSSRAEMAVRYGESAPMDPAVRSFAAVPLAMSDSTTGALCVAFDRELDFDEQLRSAFGSLAGITSASLGIGPRATLPPPPANDDATPLGVRIALLERDMAALRELLEFLGAIASQRLR